MIVAFADLATGYVRKWVDVMPENIQNQERLVSEIIVAIDSGPDLYKNRFTEHLIRAPDLDYLIPGEEIMYRGSVIPLRTIFITASGNLNTNSVVIKHRASAFAGVGAISTIATLTIPRVAAFTSVGSLDTSAVIV